MSRHDRAANLVLLGALVHAVQTFTNNPTKQLLRVVMYLHQSL
jgi:hypothetical protein